MKIQLSDVAKRTIADISKSKVDGLNSAQLTDMVNKALRKETSRLASISNKRIKRIEDVGITETPAYRNWLNYNEGEMFGVRGKTNDEVRQEYDRITMFMQQPTSTVGGATKFLQQIGDVLGMSDMSRTEIQENASRIFSLTSKIDDYMKTSGYGFAVGSDEIVKHVSEFVQSPDSSGMDDDDLLSRLLESDLYGQFNMNDSLFSDIEGDLGDWVDLL